MGCVDELVRARIVERERVVSLQGERTQRPYRGVSPSSLGLAAWLVACGQQPSADTGIPPAEFAELCGVTGPVQIFALDPDKNQRANAYEWGDGWLISMGEYEEPPIEGGAPEILARSIWHVGPCGENPRRIVDGYSLDSVLNSPLDDYLVVRSETAFLAVDPAGLRDPVEFFGLGVSQFLVDGGRLILGAVDELGNHVIHLLRTDSSWDPWQEPAPVEVILEDVVPQDAAQQSGLFWFGPRIRADYAHIDYIDSEHRLHRRTFEGGTELLLENVARLGRRVDDWQLWLEETGVEIDDEDPFGPLHVTNLVTGETYTLGEGPLSSNSRSLLTMPTSAGSTTPWIRESLGEYGADGTSLEYLPTGDISIVQAKSFPYYPVDDHHWLIGRWVPGGKREYSRIDLATGEITHLVTGQFISMSYSHDHQWIYLITGDPTCAVCAAGAGFGPWERVSAVTGERETLAHRVGERFGEYAGGYRMTSLFADEDRGGTLVLIDPDTLEESQVDTGVNVWSLRETAIMPGPILVYDVLDPNRAGLWIAKLAALPETTAGAPEELGGSQVLGVSWRSPHDGAVGASERSSLRFSGHNSAGQ